MSPFLGHEKALIATRKNMPRLLEECVLPSFGFIGSGQRFPILHSPVNVGNQPNLPFYIYFEEYFLLQ